MDNSILNIKTTQKLPVPVKSKLPKINVKSENLVSKGSPHKNLKQNRRKEACNQKTSAEKLQSAKGLCPAKNASSKTATNVKVSKNIRKPVPAKIQSQKVSSTTLSSKKTNPSRVGVSSKPIGSKNTLHTNVSDKKKASTVKDTTTATDIQHNLTDWKGTTIYINLINYTHTAKSYVYYCICTAIQTHYSHIKRFQLISIMTFQFTQ